jgi:hypothetical protein
LDKPSTDASGGLSKHRGRKIQPNDTNVLLLEPSRVKAGPAPEVEDACSNARRRDELGAEVP